MYSKEAFLNSKRSFLCLLLGAVTSACLTFIIRSLKMINISNETAVLYSTNLSIAFMAVLVVFQRRLQFKLSVAKQIDVFSRFSVVSQIMIIAISGIYWKVNLNYLWVKIFLLVFLLGYAIIINFLYVYVLRLITRHHQLSSSSI